MSSHVIPLRVMAGSNSHHKTIRNLILSRKRAPPQFVGLYFEIYLALLVGVFNGDLYSFNIVI